MATVNTALQLTQIESDVAAVSSSSATRDLLMLSLAINEATNNIQISVANTNVLPNVVSSNISPGQIYFVEDIKTLVMASNKKWIGLDGRVLRCDGTPETLSEISTWGFNGSGQLGLNNITSACYPEHLYAPYNDWRSVSSSVTGAHSVALRCDGTLWGWGFNSTGQLGNNATSGGSGVSSPVSVVGGFTDWCQVSTGGSQTLAVRTNGTLWAWGNGDCGVLGDGTVVAKSSPVSVIGGFTDWCQVSVGDKHAAAIRTDGTLWSWGDGTCGKLGDNSITNKCSPVSVAGGLNNWIDVSAGTCHTTGVAGALAVSRVYTWGDGICGQLGTSGTARRSSPVSQTTGCLNKSGWCKVSSGTFHSLAIDCCGFIATWGIQLDGRLGNGSSSTAFPSGAVTVCGGLTTGWCSGSAGDAHTIAVRTDGTMWAWGNAGSGRLGDGTTTSKTSPVNIGLGNNNSWCQVSAGCNFSSAIKVR